MTFNYFLNYFFNWRCAQLTPIYSLPQIHRVFPPLNIIFVSGSRILDKNSELQQGCPAFFVMQTVIFEVTDLLACHLGIIKSQFQVLL